MTKWAQKGRMYRLQNGWRSVLLADMSLCRSLPKSVASEEVLPDENLEYSSSSIFSEIAQSCVDLSIWI
jgi:hypothetical protein